MIEWLKPWLTQRQEKREAELKALAEAILGQIKAQAVAPLDLPSRSQTRQAVRPGIQPPADAPADTMTWSGWAREMDMCGHIPGWGYCRFGNRLGDDGMSFVFGHVRGAFGIWPSVFRVSTPAGESNSVLSCITHLRSGLGVGIFAERAVAVDAAELAEHTLSPDDMVDMHRIRAIWRTAGIVPAVNAHCYQGDSTFPIIGRSMETIMEGQPQRFS